MADRPRVFFMRRKAQRKALQLKSMTIELPTDADEPVAAMIDQSGRTYGRPRREVEQELIQRRDQIEALATAQPTQTATRLPHDPDAI